MSLRNDYGYEIPKGIAGGIFDLSLKNIFTYTIDEGSEITPGMGVASGTEVGKTVKLPVDGSTAAVFEGVFVHGSKQAENTMDGKVSASQYDAIGILKAGRIWVTIAPGTTVTAKAAVSWVVAGNNVGTFTDGSNAAEAKKVVLTAKFTGTVDADNNIAVIEY